MSKYQALIDALEAGPTEGVWNWDCDPVKNDPIGRTRYRVTTIGKTITHVYYSSYEGGPTNAAQDAAYIAAANPATIRAILADLERAEKALSDAATSLEAISLFAGKKPCQKGDTNFMGTFPELRGYAASRAGVARAALAQMAGG